MEQWKYLERYLLDGHLEISNNRAERSIKPFVIDRKNFLFANTVRGSEGSAIMFSLIQTAIENKLNPFAYLTLLFHVLPSGGVDSIEALLPGSSYIPESCYAVKREVNKCIVSF